MANIMRLGGGGGGKPKKLLSSLTEGSLVSVLEDGKLVPFYVAKHNYEADLNGEGRTLLVRKDVRNSGSVLNATGQAIYDGSTADVWLNTDYKNLLSSEVKANIGTTKFEYSPNGGSAVVTTLQKSVFLLSVTELGLTYAAAYNIEGETIPSASAWRIGYLNGVATPYWTRTPHGTTSNTSLFVAANGTVGGYGASDPDAAYRPAFTLPATMALNTEPYADGSWGLADEDILFDTETAKTTPLAPVNYTNGIADLTPVQLDEIARAISSNPNITKDSSVVHYDKGDVHRKISVGDQQNITIGGTAYAVNIIGFNHDDLALGTEYGDSTATGKAGISFQLLNGYATKYQINASYSNSGGWEGCDIRKTHLPAIFASMTSAMQGAIKTVNKKASAGSKSSVINTSVDKLFLLSEIEIFGNITHSFAGEGKQYAYYLAGNSKVKTLAGTATQWWTRSPTSTDASAFCTVTAAGATNKTGAPDTNSMTVFAYCI